MAKFIYALLFLAVWYGGVKGDAACFLQKMNECSQKLAVNIPPEDHDFILCKFKEDLFTCIREGAVECSVAQRYNFSHLEEVYSDFCRDGSALNLEMKKHKECIYNTLIKSYSCAQDVVDYAKDIKELTPEVIKELGKLSCRAVKRHEVVLNVIRRGGKGLFLSVIHCRGKTDISNCYLRNMQEHCGKEGKDVFNIYTEASEDVNELICKDILNE